MGRSQGIAKGVHGCLQTKRLADIVYDRYRKREGGVVESVLSDSQIVVSTCHSSGGRQLYKHSFDVVIIDEATQAMEAVGHSTMPTA